MDRTPVLRRPPGPLRTPKSVGAPNPPVIQSTHLMATIMRAGGFLPSGDTRAFGCFGEAVHRAEPATPRPPGGLGSRFSATRHSGRRSAAPRPRARVAPAI